MQKHHDAVTRDDGRPVVGATITVTTIAGATPTLYSDNGVTPRASNVLTTDATGEYSFYAANGRYSLAIASAGIVSETKSDVVLFDPADAGIVSVKDYGAKGDGTTDDTAAIEAAIAGAGVGGVVTFPQGETFAIATPFDLTVAGQRLVGYGASIVKAASFTGTYLLRVSAANVTIEGLEIDGTDKTIDGVSCTAGSADGLTLLRLSVHDCAYGLSTVSTSNVTVEDCHVYDVANYAMRAHNIADARALSGLRVINNIFDLSDHTPASSTQCVLLVRGTATYPTTDVIVSGNRFLQCEDPTNSSALCCEMRYVDGASFTGNYGKDGSMLVSAVLSDNVAITGNVCDGATFYGIEAAGASTVGCANYAITGNVIHGRDRLGWGVALQGSVASKGAVVSGNTIEGTTLYGVYCNEYWDDVSITGNRVDITASVAGQYGICMDGEAAISISNVSIVGNVLNGNAVGEKAIYLRCVTFATVSGNSCPDWTENGVYINGDGAACDDIVISGNTFKGLHSTCITKAGTLGDRVSSHGNLPYRRTNTTSCNDLNLNANIIEAWGTATPEAAVTAGIGSTFRNSAGGAATTLYVKESGTGNTGWVGK